MSSRFHLIPERYGRTDRFANAISVSRVSMLTRDKNVFVCKNEKSNKTCADCRMLVDEEIFCKRNLLIADRRETTSN